MRDIPVIHHLAWVLSHFTSTPSLLTLLIAFGCFTPWASTAQTNLEPSGTFHYFGRLTDSDSPADGPHDFRVGFYAQEAGGVAVGPMLAFTNVSVQQGEFILNLPAGTLLLTNSTMWLEVSVRATAPSNDYVRLEPRQQLSSAPYAAVAEVARSLFASAVVDGTSLIAGSVGTGQLADGAITANKLATAQVLRSVNGLKDEILLTAGDGLALATNAQEIQINLTGPSAGIPKNVVITSTNGVSREWATLAAALRAVVDGDTIHVYAEQVVEARQVGNGSMPELAGLYLTNRSRVKIAGVGQPRIFSPTHGDLLFIKDCTNIVVENLTFQGPGSNSTEPWGSCLINFGGTNQHLTVRHCRFLDFTSQGVAHLYGDKTSSYVTVEHCYFRNGGTAHHPTMNIDGTAIAGIGYAWTVVHNTIEDCLRGIEIEGYGPSTQSRTTVAYNWMRDIWNEGICLFATSQVADNYADILIQGNNISGTPTMREGVHAQTGIHLTGGRRITIVDNHITDMPVAFFGIGVDCGWADATDCVIRGNTVHRVGGRGIQLLQWGDSGRIDSCTVSGNQVLDCGDRGLLVTGTRHMVFGNHIHSNRGAGVDVWPDQQRTNAVYIANNFVRDNTYGIHVHTTSDGVRLGQNETADNPGGDLILPTTDNPDPLPPGPEQ